MSQGWPNWMFAAFAIGGWELCDLIARRWLAPDVRWAGAAIVVLCLIIIGVRLVRGWWLRRRHQEPPDPDEWKNY